MCGCPLLLHAHGSDVLRIKGLLALDGARQPVLVNCVRHLVYFPEHLSDWPDDDRSPELVFIVRNLDPVRIERSLKAFSRRQPALVHY
ncbi:GTP-binding protein [Paraburkholderia caribensis]|uniref:GTP-binding protein n=1 Tax=Paraburkholderia caribensis TaxID=75105 RepID=UPI00341EFC3E